MLPLWMVNKAAAIWLIAFAKQWMLLQCPEQKHTQITSAASCLKMTVFFGTCHQRTDRLLPTKDQLWASGATGAKYLALNSVSGKLQEVQTSPLDCRNNHNNVPKISAAFRNKGKQYIGSWLLQNLRVSPLDYAKKACASRTSTDWVFFSSV